MSQTKRPPGLRIRRIDRPGASAGALTCECGGEVFALVLAEAAGSTSLWAECDRCREKYRVTEYQK